MYIYMYVCVCLYLGDRAQRGLLGGGFGEERLHPLAFVWRLIAWIEWNRITTIPTIPPSFHRPHTQQTHNAHTSKRGWKSAMARA